jgi:hypothetical protein
LPERTVSPQSPAASRPPAQAPREKIAYEQPVMVDFVRGEGTGLSIPAHADALRGAGADFLTEAFRTFGAMSADNRVTRITKLEPCELGSTGGKLFLSVEYARPERDLSRDLFVKFSRDFASAFRDRRRGELISEIHIAELSRLPAFPVAAPKAFFADFEPASGTGLLITERIAFGAGSIEPLHHKCMDHELQEPLEHYRAIIKALARLAGAHKSGRLSPELERLFPYDPEAAAKEDPIPWSEPQLRNLVADYADFARRCPTLLPARVASPRFVAKLADEAVLVRRHAVALKRFLNSNPDFIALGHFNPQIDNAWFWRDGAGVLQCGLFDWQRARQMNVAYGLWGGLGGAGLEIWDHHLDELLDLFIDVFEESGGPRLALEELRLHLVLYAATMGLAAGLIECPALVLDKLPEVVEATGPFDPVFRRSEAARSFLHFFRVFLNLWERYDIGARVHEALARTA